MHSCTQDARAYTPGAPLAHVPPPHTACSAYVLFYRRRQEAAADPSDLLPQLVERCRRQEEAEEAEEQEQQDKEQARPAGGSDDGKGSDAPYIGGWQGCSRCGHLLLTRRCLAGLVTSFLLVH